MPAVVAVGQSSLAIPRCAHASCRGSRAIVARNPQVCSCQLSWQRQNACVPWCGEMSFSGAI
eukprot:1195585-Prorocentrum_minimum.AAC.3